MLGARVRLRALIVASAIAAATLLAACGSSSDDKTTGATTSNAASEEAPAAGTKPLRVAYIPAFGTLPIHVAAEKGLFERNGIDLKATEGSDIAAWAPALGKQFDIALSSPSAFLAATVAGLPLQVISGMQVATAEHPNNVLISKKPIGDIAELSGRKVGVIALAGGAYDSVRYLLTRAGVDLNDVRFIAAPLPTQADQVNAGQLDAAVSAAPFFGALRQRGFSVSDDVTVQAINEASGGRLTSAASAFMISSREFLEQNAELGESFRTAIEEAIDYIDQNPDEARAMATSWLKLPSEVVESAPMPGLSADESLEDLEAWVEVSTTTGTLRKAPPPVEELIWPSAVGRPTE